MLAWLTVGIALLAFTVGAAPARVQAFAGACAAREGAFCSWCSWSLSR